MVACGGSGGHGGAAGVIGKLHEQGHNFDRLKAKKQQSVGKHGPMEFQCWHWKDSMVQG